MESSLRQRLLFLSRKTLKALLIALQGAQIGLGLNFLWHYILAVLVGWGDTAPDWYFQMQGFIFLAFFLLGLFGWSVLYQRLNDFMARKKFEKYPFPHLKILDFHHFFSRPKWICFLLKQTAGRFPTGGKNEN